MTWNLWWRNGPWQERQVPIARTLADLGADVICLQEVWAEEGGTDQAAVLAGHLGFHHVRTPAPYRKRLSLGNAVLSRWPITSTRSVALPGADGAPSVRTALVAQVDAPFASFPVVTTHLAWEYDASATRCRQAAALAQVVADARAGPGQFPPVVTGDLNATPGSDEIRMLTGEAPVPVAGLVLHDAWAVAGDDSPGFTWSSHNRYLAEASRPQRRLDYVMVAYPRPRPLGNVASCRLAGTEPVDGVQPSDHYAVVADLRTQGDR